MRTLRQRQPCIVGLLLAAAGVADAAALRVGVIGTGCIGIEHINNLHLVDNVQITAIADCHEPSRRSALATNRVYT